MFISGHFHLLGMRKASIFLVLQSEARAADRTFFLCRLHLERLSHPVHNTTLLRLEGPGSKCAKLHTVAASNNYCSCTCFSCLFYATRE